MLLYWDGRLFYSDALVWLSAVSLALAVPAAWATSAYLPYCPSDDALRVADFGLAAVLLNSVVVPWLRWSVLPGWVAGRPALYALRATSALVGVASLLWLTAELVPRQVLAVAALCSACASYNAACWSAALWLRLQGAGLGELLPPNLRDVLLRTPPIELLGTDAPLAQVRKHSHYYTTTTTTTSCVRTILLLHAHVNAEQMSLQPACGAHEVPNRPRHDLHAPPPACWAPRRRSRRSSAAPATFHTE